MLGNRLFVLPQCRNTEIILYREIKINLKQLKIKYYFYKAYSKFSGFKSENTPRLCGSYSPENVCFSEDLHFLMKNGKKWWFDFEIYRFAVLVVTHWFCNMFVHVCVSDNWEGTRGTTVPHVCLDIWYKLNFFLKKRCRRITELKFTYGYLCF